MKVLVIATLDLMVAVLLKPWLKALARAGYEVHVACAPGRYFSALAAEGFHMHAVPLKRSYNPLAHAQPLLELYRLFRGGGFVLANTHSPVAAAVGRLAAWLAGCPTLIYTVHGFHAHEGMWRPKRWLFWGIEWLLGRITDHFLFVSEEDRRTALALGIAGGESQTGTILNGIDLSDFRPAAEDERESLREELGIPAGRPVVGIVGRMVKEKGYREFLEMASRLRGEAVFLAVGDCFPGDRGALSGWLREQAAGLPIRFTGFTERVRDYLRVMDIFVLPSYREGFPRSVLEAMGTALPVVATKIRGCREAVVDGVTGLLVPPRDPSALTAAVRRLLEQPEEARQMGLAGRRRAVELYDQRMVEQRFVDGFRQALERQAAARPGLAGRLRRLVEAAAAGAGLLLLAPALGAIAAAIRLSMGGPVLFRQPRAGFRERVFVLYKFRTLTEERDGDGRLLPDERRLTRLGRFLRSTSLDELPQLWNVLQGDMALVGPRPLFADYLPLYNQRQRRRHEVRPGLTGWAQIHGRNALGWEERFDLDVWYVEHAGWKLDLKILWRTLRRVVGREGISQPGEATMSRFEGSPSGGIEQGCGGN